MAAAPDPHRRKGGRPSDSSAAEVAARKKKKDGRSSRPRRNVGRDVGGRSGDEETIEKIGV